MSGTEIVLRLVFGLGLIALAVWIAVGYVRFEIRNWRNRSVARSHPVYTGPLTGNPTRVRFIPARPLSPTEQPRDESETQP